ncbi:hypothetical protein OAF27_03010, partial [Verrucomicrobiales bacterium]|nr:hypothetical protein [Verrucomicrobiales bacterium]
VDLIFALGKLPFPIFEEIGSRVRNTISKQADYSTQDDCFQGLADVGMWTRPWGELGLRISDGTRGTFWGMFIDEMRVNGQSKSEILEALITTECTPRETARKRFAEAFNRSDKGAMAAALDDLSPDLLTLTGAGRVGLAEVVHSKFEDLKVPDVSPELQTFFDEIGEELIGDVSEIARAELKTGFDTVDFRYSDRDRLTKRIVSLMSVDAALAAEYCGAVLSTLAERTASAGRSRRPSSSSSNGINTPPVDTYYEYVWRNMAGKDELRKQWFEFCVGLKESGAERLIGFETYWLGKRASLLDDYWDSWEKQVEGREKGDKSFDPVVWMKMAEEYAEKEESHRAAWREQMLLVALDRERQEMVAERCLAWIEETRFAETHPLEARAAYVQLATYEWDALDEEKRELAGGMIAAWLRDKTISSRLRVEGASLMIARNGPLAGVKQFAGGVCDALLDYAADGRPPFTPAVEGLLKKLALAKAPVDSEKVTEVAEKWETALSGREGGSAFREPERAAPFAKALAMLALNSGNMELAIPMVRKDIGFFEGDIELMLELHTVGEKDTALRVAAPPGRLFRKSTLKWDDTVAEKAASLIADIPDDAQRYRVECLVASLSQNGDDAAKNRSARLLPLAEVFAERAPEDENARIECLAWLLSDPSDLAVARPLAPILMEIQEEWLINQTLNSEILGSEMANALRKVLDCALWFAARENRDFAPAIRQLDDLFARGSQVDRSNFSYAIDQTNALLFEAIVGAFADDFPPSDEVLALSKKGLTDSIALKYQRNRNSYRTFGLAFAAHVLDGKSAEFFEWVGALEGEGAELYKDNIEKAPIRMITAFESLSGLMRGRGEGIPTLANIYFEAVASDPAASAFVFTNSIDVRNLARRKFVDGEMIEKMLENAGDSFPRRGWWQVTREILRTASDRSNEERNIVIEKLKILEDAGDTETANLAKIYRAEQIGLLGEDPEEAVALIEGADLKVLDENPQKYFKDQIKRWKAAAKKKKEKADEETS